MQGGKHVKATNYCFEFPLENPRGVKIKDGGMLVYNALTNALAAIDTDKFNVFDEFRKNGTPIEDEELIKQLAEGGFLVEDSFNELHELRYRMLGGRYTSNQLSLTIAPTSDCNFRCVYCYEKNVLRNAYMNEEIIKGITDFFDSRVSQIRNFSVTWYGGEPLLCMDTIERLSKHFITECEKHNIQYSAGIITNGYLLTREKIEKLNNLKVDFYQITLDGTKETHDANRPLRNGGGTYDVIINNIVKYFDVLPTVAIRINVDKNNWQAADEVANFIKENGLSEKVRAYLGRIMNDNDDPKLAVTCFSVNDFAGADIEYSKKYHTDDFAQKYPSLRGNYCGADCATSFVIDSDGSIYKCWNEVGRKELAVGHVLNRTPKGNYEIFDKYMLFDPTQDPECSKCKVLPICMGGCPYYRVHGRSNEQCSVFKNSLQSYISYVAENIMHQREEREKNKTVESA